MGLIWVKEEERCVLNPHGVQHLRKTRGEIYLQELNLHFAGFMTPINFLSIEIRKNICRINARAIKILLFNCHMNYAVKVITKC